MIDCQLTRNIKSYIRQTWIKKISRSVSRVLSLKKRHSFSLVLVDDKDIHRLNRQYRGKNKITDVLSFANDQSTCFIDPLLDKGYMGEVVISVPQAKRQAKKFGSAFQQEIARLVIHGLIHLFGYDHENVSPAKKRKMIELEERAIKELNK